MLNTPFKSVVVPFTMVLSLLAMSNLTVASMSSVVSCESTRTPLMTAARKLSGIRQPKASKIAKNFFIVNEFNNV